MAQTIPNCIIVRIAALIAEPPPCNATTINYHSETALNSCAETFRMSLKVSANHAVEPQDQRQFLEPPTVRFYSSSQWWLLPSAGWWRFSPCRLVRGQFWRQCRPTPRSATVPSAGDIQCSGTGWCNPWWPIRTTVKKRTPGWLIV